MSDIEIAPDLLDVDLTKESEIYRAPVTRGLAKSEDVPVDRQGGKFKAGLIRGASMITRGEALGHGMFIDAVMLKQVADAINASQEFGIKSRFAHPDMSGDGIGKMTAKAFDAHVSGDQVIGDLHMLDSAKRTPDGDLASYVMDLAQEAPEAFGTSIAFQVDRAAMEEFRVANLKEIERTDRDGMPIKRREFQSPDPLNKKNQPHVRLKKLTAVDVVDEPAANPNGLFHRGPFDLLQHGDAALEFAFGLTDEAPDLTALGIDATRLRGFVARFATSHGITIEERKMSEKPDSGPEEKPEKQEKPAENLAKGDQTPAKPDPVKVERERASGITSACVLAGKADLASKYIDDPAATPESVKSALFGMMCSERAPVPNGAPAPGTSTAANPNAKYEAEFDAHPDVYAAMGVSKEQYVLSRRRDDGLDKLSIVPAKK